MPDANSPTPADLFTDSDPLHRLQVLAEMGRASLIALDQRIARMEALLDRSRARNIPTGTAEELLSQMLTTRRISLERSAVLDAMIATLQSKRMHDPQRIPRTEPVGAATPLAPLAPQCRLELTTREDDRRSTA